MAKHCPRCDVHTDDEFADECPVCFKPLLTDEEHARGWGAYAGNPGSDHATLQRVRRVYGIIAVAGCAAAAAYYAWFWIRNQP
jgi:hypothetical protein